MTTITLSPNHTFSIEPYEKLRVRIIVSENREELVCRKESVYKLKQFLALDEGRAFKGRLQLVKRGDSIAVEVKGEVLGDITVEQFLALLEKDYTGMDALR